MNELLSLAHFEPMQTASGSPCRDSGLVQQPIALAISSERQGELWPRTEFPNCAAFMNKKRRPMMLPSGSAGDKGAGDRTAGR